MPSTDILYVGDPHVTVAELADCHALLGLVYKVVLAHEPDCLVFLGDQYHHHGIVHLEVMDFWRHWLTQFSRLKTEVLLLVGNHDKPGNGRQDINALMAHENLARNIHIISQPTSFPDDLPGVVFVPHQDSSEKFLEACRAHHDKPLVVCHQTFNGGRYENGFYAKDGIDPELVPQKHIWSGHIHAPQSFGKVWYMGAPRWRTSADANTERSLWLMTHDENGASFKANFPTGNVCRQIVHVDVNEDTDLDAVLGPMEPKKDNITVTMTGSGEWLKTYVPKVERDGFKVRTVKVGLQLAPRVRESEGIGTAFRKFTKSYQAKHGTPVEVLEKMAEERISHA